MKSVVVKIEKSERQTRVTIPKIMAEKAGLLKQEYCWMGLTASGDIMVRKFDKKTNYQDKIS